MQGRAHVHRRRFRLHFRFWKESRILERRVENKRREFGISIPECRSCYRRQRDGVPAVRSPEPLGRRDLRSVSAIRPLAETLFYLVVSDREGVIAFSDAL
jgi:hypothetical protein